MNTVGINLNFSADDYIKYWLPVKSEKGESETEDMFRESLKKKLCSMVMNHFDELVQINECVLAPGQEYLNIRMTMNVLAPETNVRRLTWYRRNDYIKAAQQLQKMIAAGNKEGEGDVQGSDQAGQLPDSSSKSNQ